MAGRRTFICFALSSGIPPQIVMKWTGHSDYKAMRPYIDIADLLIQWKHNGELIPCIPRKVHHNDNNDIEILLKKWFSSEYLPEIHNLINDFGLTPVTEEWLI